MKTINYIDIEKDKELTVDEALIGSVIFLLDNGADIDAFDGIALEYACGRGVSIDLLQLLINKGADVNINNGSPLHTAVISNRLDALEMLLDNGADASLDNFKALRWASIYRYTDMVRLLLYSVTFYWVETDANFEKVRDASRANKLSEFVNNIKEQMVA